MNDRLVTPEEFRKLYPDLAAKAKIDATADDREVAWLEQKRGKFGASSASVFWTPTLKLANNAGLQKYLILKAAELDGLMKGQINAWAIRHGNDEELPGAIDFMEKSGLPLTKYGDDQEWIAWGESDQVGCTPDGLIKCSYKMPGSDVFLKDQLIVFEQKNHDTINAYEEFASMENGEGLIKTSLAYGVQIQHQMMVTGAVAGIFQSRYTRTRTGKSELSWFVVPRDEAFISAHSARLHQAIGERDAYRIKRNERKLLDLKQFVSQ